LCNKESYAKYEKKKEFTLLELIVKYDFCVFVSALKVKSSDVFLAQN